MTERAYHCPVEVTLEVIGARWTPVILAHLKENDRLRFGQIRRLIPDISEKMLTQRLRELERAGIIDRTLVRAAPAQVEYRLTTAGRGLSPVLNAMWDWGRQRATTMGLTITPVPADPRPGPATE
ncbi:helix-turn-helix domain-containing protein [Frankia sp. R82]|uniref:winged helix-turn-helix transcriptional regulator n=1 Tax=Frankia sp. R82 TaxID=2950553 RepID=UPI002043C37C|nr:helix-turn-helix domain-containing protein [Frankia sp. R82]MCM3882515.1 helix-turn-helix transcriptional regulator [Frankia sp. R82]